jgi:hypothetical protein
MGAVFMEIVDIEVPICVKLRLQKDLCETQSLAWDVDTTDRSLLVDIGDLI